MLSMERLFLSLFTLTIVFGTPSSVFADISGLIPCRDSSTFQRRLDSSVAKLTARLTNYEEGTPAYLALQDQIDRTKLRFDKYGKQGLLCGAEGLSYLIADGRASHAGECCTPSSSLGVFSAIIVCRALSKKNFKKVGKTSLKV